MKKLAILAAAALFAVPNVGCRHCGGDLLGGSWFGGGTYDANYCNDCCTTVGFGDCNACGTAAGDTFAPVLPAPQTYQGN